MDVEIDGATEADAGGLDDTGSVTDPTGPVAVRAPPAALAGPDAVAAGGDGSRAQPPNAVITVPTSRPPAITLPNPALRMKAAPRRR